MAVVVLDESMTVLRFGVPDEDQPDAVLVENARSASQNYLETLNNAFIDPAERVPPPPDLDRLREEGVPTRHRRGVRRRARRVKLRRYAGGNCSRS